MDLGELVERATGLGRSDGGDMNACERLLNHIRSGSAEAVDVLKAIVAGSQLSDAGLNARVLTVLHWLIVVGGPIVLPSAVSAMSPRKSSPGVRVARDVLRSLGYDEGAVDVLYDDNKVRKMKIWEQAGIPPDALEKCRAGSASLIAAAVEAYAIAMGRKLIFHGRFPPVESNYSLDRFFRALHVENYADEKRRVANSDMHSLIISKAAYADMSLIAHAAVVAAQRLEVAEAPMDTLLLSLGEACNAYAFAEYLRMKTGSDGKDFDLEAERRWLARKLRMLSERSGAESRLLKRFVDGNVFRMVSDDTTRPCRPESKHRREIICSFTSFETMHKALKPPISEDRFRSSN